MAKYLRGRYLSSPPNKWVYFPCAMFSCPPGFGAYGWLDWWNVGRTRNAARIVVLRWCCAHAWFSLQLSSIFFHQLDIDSPSENNYVMLRSLSSRPSYQVTRSRSHRWLDENVAQDFCNARMPAIGANNFIRSFFRTRNIRIRIRIRKSLMRSWQTATIT